MHAPTGDGVNSAMAQGATNKGVAASDLELAVALFRQGCFDLFNGVRILGEEDWDGANAVALAQCQQGCEKALKS